MNTTLSDVNPMPPPELVQAALEHHLPSKTDYGIAFVGCGGIINYAHIPAYRASGFNLIGGYDRNRESAEQTAQTHGLNRVYTSLDELLADPAVQIVDTAIVPWEQRAVVEQIIAAHKHVLCQKPLADSYTEALEIVDLARQAGVKLAVQQQFRWSPIMCALRALLRAGWLGDLLEAQIQVSITTP